MSLFDQLKEPLDAVLNTARRVAELSMSLLNGQHQFRDELRRLRRDLPHLTDKAMAILPAEEPVVSDLKHELRCVLEDTDALGKWLEPTSDELLNLIAQKTADAASRYGQAHQKALSKGAEYRQVINESCNRAYQVAVRTCNELEQRQSKQSNTRREALRQGNKQREEEVRRIHDEAARRHRLMDSSKPVYEAIMKAQMEAVEARKQQKEFDAQTHEQAIAHHLNVWVTALREAGSSNRLDDLDMTQMFTHFFKGNEGFTREQEQHAFQHAEQLLREAISRNSLNNAAKDLCDLELRPLRKWFHLLIGVVSGELLFFPKPPHGMTTEATSEEKVVGVSPKTPVDFLIVTALVEERDAVLSKLPVPQAQPPSEDDVRHYYTATVDAKWSDSTTCVYSVALVSLANMGRLQAAATAQDAIRRWRPRIVMLVGIAGGLESSGVGLGDILIADLIVDYELQKLTEGRHRIGWLQRVLSLFGIGRHQRIVEHRAQIRWNAHPVDQRLLEFAMNFPPDKWHPLVGISRPQAGEPGWHKGTVATGDKVIAVNDVLESYKKQSWSKLIGVEMEAGGVALVAHQSPARPGFFMVRCVSDLLANKNQAKVEAWRDYACDVAAAYAIAIIRNGPLPPASPQLSR
jgi:nucleoside phosphorylase